MTHLLPKGSPAIDFGVSDNCFFVNSDQQIFPRKVDIPGNGTICDSGSVEVRPDVLENLMFESSFQAGEGQQSSNGLTATPIICP